MRLPFDFNNSELNQEARIKFLYSSPEHHQNIEISMDGDEVTVDALLDAFQRFLGALGVSIPENVIVGFIEASSEEDLNENSGTIKFTLDDNEDDEEDDDEEKE